MKKILTLSLLAFALLALPGAAGDLSGAGAAKTDAPQAGLAQPDQADQPDLQPALGVPAPKAMSCTDICSGDFKACRDSCHSLACYNSCRAALDVCLAGCA